MSNNQTPSSGFMIPPVIQNPPPALDDHSHDNAAHTEPSAENVSMLQSALGKYTTAEDSIMKSTNIHEHKYPKLFLRGTAVCGLLMLLLFVIWMLSSPYGYPWFIHPFHVLGTIVAVLFAIGNTSNDLHKKLYSVHTSFLVLTVGMFIIANLYTRAFPWFIFPCTFFCLIFCIHTLWYKFHSMLNPLSIHLLFYVALNIMFFVWYCYGTVSFPWNLPILAVWTVAIIVHALIHILFWKKILEAISSKVSKGFSSQAPPMHNMAAEASSGASAAVSQPFEVPKNQDPFAVHAANEFDQFQNSGPYVQPQQPALQFALPPEPVQQATPQVASQYPQYNAV